MALAGIAVAAAISGAQPSSADQASARLTIAAVGADLEFRSLGLNPDSFLVRDGEARIFQNLKPGRYVVVQAPPFPTGTLWMHCSDGDSFNQYDLQSGDDITCTFTIE